MEQTLNKLPVKHISEATTEIVEYITHRRSGIVKSLKTRWSKFNRQCMGGIEPNTIYTIAGISGSGKNIKNIAVFMRNHRDYNWTKTVKAGMLIPW